MADKTLGQVGTETRKVYSDEFKREAVRLADERGNVTQVARDLGISDSLLFKWKKRLVSVPSNEQAFPGVGNARDAEVARLQRELARVKEENTILIVNASVHKKRQWVSSRKSLREIPVCAGKQRPT